MKSSNVGSLGCPSAAGTIGISCATIVVIPARQAVAMLCGEKTGVFSTWLAGLSAHVNVSRLFPLSLCAQMRHACSRALTVQKAVTWPPQREQQVDCTLRLL